MRVSAATLKSITKLITVGRFTKKRGGKRYNSSKGLNALITEYTSGNTMNTAVIVRIKKITTVPPVERLMRRCILIKLFLIKESFPSDLSYPQRTSLQYPQFP